MMRRPLTQIELTLEDVLEMSQVYQAQMEKQVHDAAEKTPEALICPQAPDNRLNDEDPRCSSGLECHTVHVICADTPATSSTHTP